MPRTKKDKSAKSTRTPFWAPKKKGETITGKFLFWREFLFNKGKRNERPGVVMVLDSFLVTMSYELTGYFSKIYGKVKTGDKFKLVYTGMVDTASGFKVKKFDVYRNGVKLESAGGFKNEPASPKALKAFFNSQD